MTRQGVSTVPVLVTIDRNVAGSTLCQQIYRALLAEIMEGHWQAGARLPGSRVLASDLGVSRTTVLAVYERLRAEGYIESRAGSGTRVCASQPPRSQRRAAGTASATVSALTLSKLGARLIAAYGGPAPLRPTHPPIPFSLGVPALDAFPVTKWARLTAQRWRMTPRVMLAPDDGAGYTPLREAIAGYVVKARAIRCTPDQILITAGGQQGIDLAARLLLNPGDAVWVGEYCYEPSKAAFAGVGARVVEVPVDEEGLDVERAVTLAPDARLAFITPACEPPFCVPMSLRRRIALLDWAQRTGAWIIEDDYNGELRYDGTPLPALQAFDHPGARRVIYLRTFTKTLFPALRLGYGVLPPELVEAFTRARLILDRHSPTAEQAVLADFIAGGHFARHVRNIRELNAERQHVFLDLASDELGELLRFSAASAGIRLVGRLPDGVLDHDVAREAARRGILVEPLSREAAGPSAIRGLVFGYVPFQTAEIRRGFAQLAQAIRSVQSIRIATLRL